MKKYFLNEALLATDNVFEQSKINLVFNFIIIFLILISFQVGFYLYMGYTKPFALQLLGMAVLFLNLFLFRAKKNVQLFSGVFVGLTAFIGGVMSFMLNIDHYDAVGIAWVFFLLLSAFLLVDGSLLYILLPLIFIPLIYSSSMSLFHENIFYIEFLHQKNFEDANKEFQMAIPLISSAYLLWNTQNVKKLAQQQIFGQKKTIEEKNKEIVQSIEYAQGIQSDFLCREEDVKQIFPQSFVIYKPKDIVSGDFFWAKKCPHYSWIAVADCTGHGVPGALITMKATYALNQVITTDSERSPGTLIAEIDSLMQKSISGRNTSVNDGMDISLIKVNYANNTFEFAGANARAWVIQKGELTELKGNRFPVGPFFNEKIFENNIKAFEKGDMLYLFSDGMQDQFGGDKGKKLGKQRLKDLLLAGAALSPEAQKDYMLNEFSKWMNENQQVDDVTLLGVIL